MNNRVLPVMAFPHQLTRAQAMALPGIARQQLRAAGNPPISHSQAVR